jgi:repressor LexA
MLTKKQKEVLDYIKDFLSKEKVVPSLREVASGLGMKSHAGVHRYVRVLEEKGYLKKGGYHSKRDLELLGGESELVLAGSVAAGEPLEVVEEGTETIEIPKYFIDRRKKRFVLQIEGDSMQDMGLLSGDYVVIEQRKIVDNGEVIVAMLNGGATLKEFRKEDGVIKLCPKNERYRPIKVKEGDQFFICGVLVGSFRKY